jgi:DNA polymerase-4
VVAALGRSAGEHLHALANGIDGRAVEPERQAKSIGHEQTFAADLFAVDELGREIVRMADAVATRLRAGGLAGRTVSIKVRFGSFETITRSVTAPEPVDTAVAIGALARGLLDQVDTSSGVRLLGVSVAQLSADAPRQLRLDDLVEAEAGDWDGASKAIDEIRKRFGAAAIGPASLVRAGADGRPSVVPLRRGQQQWGPDETPKG